MVRAWQGEVGGGSRDPEEEAGKFGPLKTQSGGGSWAGQSKEGGKQRPTLWTSVRLASGPA